MKLHGLEDLGGVAAATLVRHWMETLDVRVRYVDPALDPAHPACDGRAIYVFWHEYILAPLAFRNRCSLAMLLSRHRDADILFRVGGLMGFELIRGSTNRGGAAALRALLAKSRQRHVAITPDGPRGPRRRLAPGAVYLASKIGLPIVPLGIGFDRPWRMPTWDRFAVPRPFSRGRAALGEAIYVPEDADRDELERRRRRVEDALQEVTIQAETWAVQGRTNDDAAPSNDYPARRRDLLRLLGRRAAAPLVAPADEAKSLESARDDAWAA